MGGAALHVTRLEGVRIVGVDPGVAFGLVLRQLDAVERDGVTGAP